MESQKENTKRIAKNTIMLYIRMLFGMLVSLYTSRVVLQALGVEDYGIYNVVGGVVSMFSMISSSLSSSVSRFLTFELGKRNIEGLKRIFSTSLSIHVVLSLIIVILSETIGLWFLNTHMTIPEYRLYAANMVFHASLFSFVIGLLSVPFNASIVAHEKMTAFAYIGVLDIILRLIIVLFIAYSGYVFDRLIVYSLLSVLVSFIMQLIYWVYCKHNFKECSFTISFDSYYWKKMSSFAGWNFIGCSSVLLKDQGVNILLNMFCGPIVNAARGISMSVNNAISSFAYNFTTAVNPQITKSYASGDEKYMFFLIEKSARFSYYILLLLSLPVMFQTDFILSLWLVDYPEHTVGFVRLVLILSLIGIISNPLINLQLATGKLRDYQLSVGGLSLMNFPLTYLCLKVGLPPESTLMVAIFIAICCLFLRLYFLKSMVGLQTKRFISNVLYNILIVTIFSCIIPIFVQIYLKNDFIEFFIVTLVCVFGTLVCIFFIGLNYNERIFIIEKINNSLIRKNK